MSRRGFRRSGREVQLRLQDGEREVVADLLLQLEAFVAPAPGRSDGDPLEQLVGIEQSAERPQDPALLRLLPDAYRDDDEAASDFRRFTERGLREQKASDARTARATLQRDDDRPPIRLSLDEGEVWLRALNDLRLALGVRLGITEDEDGQDEPSGVYPWLTWLQSTLIDALMPGEGPLP